MHISQELVDLQSAWAGCWAPLGIHLHCCLLHVASPLHMHISVIALHCMMPHVCMPPQKEWHFSQELADCKSAWAGCWAPLGIHRTEYARHLACCC